MQSAQVHPSVLDTINQIWQKKCGKAVMNGNNHFPQLKNAFFKQFSPCVLSPPTSCLWLHLGWSLNFKVSLLEKAERGQKGCAYFKKKWTSEYKRTFLWSGRGRTSLHVFQYMANTTRNKYLGTWRRNVNWKMFYGTEKFVIHILA